MGVYAICSCVLQLWVERHLIAHGKADGGEVVLALFAVILSGLALNQAANIHLRKGRLLLIDYEVITRSTSSSNLEGTTLPEVQGTLNYEMCILVISHVLKFQF